MKGGGLTWVGWLMVGGGVMFIYAGMTGQSVVSELASVLNGKAPKPSPTGPAGSSNAAEHPTPSPAGPAGSANAAEHPRTIPNPRY